MRRRTGRTPALLLALLLTACVPGRESATPRLVTPPPSGVTPTIIVLTSTVPPGGTATAPAPPGGTATPPPAATPGPLRATAVAPPVPPGPSPTATVVARATTNTSGRPHAVKLTGDGCCALPRWFPDSSGVYFYAAPGQAGPNAGTWRVPRDGGTPQLLTERYGTFAPNAALVAYPDGEVTRVARLDGTVIATVPNGGKRAYLPSSNDRVAWMTPANGVPVVSTSLDPPFQITIMRLDTGEIVTPPALFIGETIQWFPDGRRILINGRDSRAEHPGLWILDVATGNAALLFESPWLESPAISPDGRQIIYTATLQRDQQLNGTWLINADGSGRQRLAISGGYRWLPDSSGVLYIPAPTDRPNDELWRYTVADKRASLVVGAEQTPFTVAQDEWEIAPDGQAITFRSATDNAIWSLRLAP
ncbi:MAG TPA: hypothetical protein VIL85_14395 [Thermomicrobiales bacterium]|jgi:hypothetical protein